MSEREHVIYGKYTDKLLLVCGFGLFVFGVSFALINMFSGEMNMDSIIISAFVLFIGLALLICWIISPLIVWGNRR